MGDFLSIMCRIDISTFPLEKGGRLTPYCRALFPSLMAQEASFRRRSDVIQVQSLRIAWLVNLLSVQASCLQGQMGRSG